MVKKKVTEEDNKKMLDAIEDNEIRCPHCKRIIKELVSNATATCSASIDKVGNVDLDQSDMYDNYETDEWMCPECSEQITYDQEDAVNFLKGEKWE